LSSFFSGSSASITSSFPANLLSDDFFSSAEKMHSGLSSMNFAMRLFGLWNLHGVMSTCSPKSAAHVGTKIGTDTQLININECEV